jgi:predicted amidohydrolase
MAPALGNVTQNLERHHAWCEQARDARVDLLVFPELSLTGYNLQDLVPEVAIAVDGPEVAELADLSRSFALVAGAIVETAGHRFYNAALYFEGGALRHWHRKVYLPTYGLFDEARDVAHGQDFVGFESVAGGTGLAICEDLWHPSCAYLYSLQGLDLLICPSAGPGRGVRGRDLGSAASWERIGRAYAQVHTCFVAYCNRTGTEDGVNFPGGSFVAGPGGELLESGPTLVEALVVAELHRAELRRQRIAGPMLRDERPLVTLRELHRILDRPGALGP